MGQQTSMPLPVRIRPVPFGPVEICPARAAAGQQTKKSKERLALSASNRPRLPSKGSHPEGPPEGRRKYFA